MSRSTKKQEHCADCDPSFNCWGDYTALCRKMMGRPPFLSPPTLPSPSPSIETLLRRLLNKAHTVGQDDYREGASDASLKRHDEELDAAREEVMKAINALRVELATAKEQVVWGFHGEEVPQYAQGSKGEHEMTEPITAEEANGLVKTIVKLRTAIDEAMRDLEVETKHQALATLRAALK